jgi:2-oxoglutarate ferredoxin oxidoreductase subunit beta
VVHDAHDPDPSIQFALSRLDDPTMAHVPVGVFRDVQRPTYDDMVRAQLASAVDAAGGRAADDDLARLLAGKDTWTV